MTLFPCQISWLPSTLPSNRVLSFNWKVCCVITALGSRCCILAVGLLCPHCFLCCFWFSSWHLRTSEGCLCCLESEEQETAQIFGFSPTPLSCMVRIQPALWNHTLKIVFLPCSSQEIVSSLQILSPCCSSYLPAVLSSILTVWKLWIVKPEIWNTTRNSQRSSTQDWILPDSWNIDVGFLIIIS